MRSIGLLLLLVGISSPAFGQAWAPPYCTGANRALQFDQRGWLCATITGSQGPAGPSGPAGPPGPALPAAPTSDQCITARWNGTAWECVPTNYVTAN